MHIRIPARGKGAQQVQGCSRLKVGLQHLVRVGNSCLGGESKIVDDVAAVAGQLHPILGFHVGAARLGELPRHAAHLDHRHLGTIGQHHRHLQHHLEGVANAVSAEFGKTFGAITALQQERLAARYLAKVCRQAARLACEHQRRIGRQLGLDSLQCCIIRVCGHLDPGLFAPVRFLPFRHWFAPYVSS